MTLKNRVLKNIFDHIVQTLHTTNLWNRSLLNTQDYLHRPVNRASWATTARAKISSPAVAMAEETAPNVASIKVS